MPSPPLLVVHMGGIGDFLLSLPALRALNTPLHVTGQTERMNLAVHGKVAQRALSLEALDFSSVFSTPSPRLRKAVAEYAGALVWMQDEDDRIAGALKECGIAQVRCFPGVPPPQWAGHASSYFANCTRQFAHACGLPYPSRIEPALLFPRATSGGESAQRLQESEEVDIIIHPGSGGQRKNWPLANFVRLAQALEAHSRKVQWLQGPAEEELGLPAPGQMLPPRPLVDLLQTLQKAALYIGNDSGISHLAGLAGTPTLALFGPTDPQVWRPLGPQVRVLHQPPGWPAFEEALEACYALIGSETAPGKVHQSAAIPPH